MELQGGELLDCKRNVASQCLGRCTQHMPCCPHSSIAFRASVQASSYVAAIPPVDSWYAAYVAWLPTSSHARALTPAGLPATSADFHAWLAEFLDTKGARYVRSVIFFDGNRTSIKATKVQAYFKNAPNSRYQVRDCGGFWRRTLLARFPTLSRRDAQNKRRVQVQLRGPSQRRWMSWLDV